MRDTMHFFRKTHLRRLTALLMALILAALPLMQAAPAVAEGGSDASQAESVQEITATLEQLAAALRQLQQTMDGSQTDLTDEITGLQSQLATAKQNLDAMQSQADALSEKIDALADGAEKSALKDKLNAVKQAIADADDRVQEAETKLSLITGNAANAEAVARLLTNLGALTGQIQEMLAQMQQIIAGIAGDETVRQQLAQALADLKTACDNFNKTMTMAQQLITQLAQEAASITQNPQLKAMVDALYAQVMEALNNTNTTIADVDAIVKKANAMLDQLNDPEEKARIQQIINELIKEIQETNNKLGDLIENADKAIDDANIGELSDETIGLIKRLQTLSRHAERTLSKADTTLDDLDGLINDMRDVIDDLRHPRFIGGELEIKVQGYGDQYTLTASINNGSSDVRYKWSTGETTTKITVSEDRLDEIWVIAYDDDHLGILRAYLKNPELKDVEAYAGNGCAYIAWKPSNEAFNRPAADVYRVKVTDEAGEYVTTVKAGRGASGVLVPNLMNDTRYDFVITAESIVGESNRERVNITPRATAPTDPSGATSNAGIAVYPQMLETTVHSAYLSGYSDGTVRPNQTISRAETAAMFSRLLNNDMTSRYTTTLNSYNDVDADAWYNQPVSTLSLAGLMSGRPDGRFDPDADITRGEFAAIVSRMAENLSGSAASNFRDIDGHWAEADIRKAASLGWIRGYADGAYHPDAPITRAEACAIINRMTGRTTESPADMAGEMITFTDNVDTSAWYYTTIQEAANTHYYIRKDGKEHWIVY